MADNDDIQYMLGEINGKLDVLTDKILRMRQDVDTLMAYKSNLMGVGTAITFGIATVGFVFGDLIRSAIRKTFGN